MQAVQGPTWQSRAAPTSWLTQGGLPRSPGRCPAGPSPGTGFCPYRHQVCPPCCAFVVLSPIYLSQRPIHLGRQSVCHINGLAAAWFWIALQIEHHLAVYSLCRILACQAHRQLYNSSGAEVLKVNVYAIVTLTQYYRVPGCLSLQHTLPMTNACL